MVELGTIEKDEVARCTFEIHGRSVGDVFFEVYVTTVEYRDIDPTERLSIRVDQNRN